MTEDLTSPGRTGQTLARLMPTIVLVIGVMMVANGLFMDATLDAGMPGMDRVIDPVLVARRESWGVGGTMVAAVGLVWTLVAAARRSLAKRR